MSAKTGAFFTYALDTDKASGVCEWKCDPATQTPH